jgi:bifunctional DNA-binding transcriptional regulator/antitoxin component of YhaV-PrlF toxin-antitoxin module
MVQDETDTEQTDEEQNPTFGVPGVEVVDNGRIRLPPRQRDRYDIEEDDVVDIRVRAPSVMFWALDIVVDGRGRIRIPSRKRDLYEVDDGDVVDIDVMITGMTHDGD